MFKNADISAKYNSLLNNAKLATSGKELQNLRLQLSAMRSEIKATNPKWHDTLRYFQEDI